MGIAIESFSCIDKAIELIGKSPNEIEMLEFGSQRIVLKCFPANHKVHPYNISKKYFESIGIKHISVDINNQWESLYMDLSKIQSQWKNKFDILTNCGTTEHVQNGQYQAFWNAHFFTKPNGYMIHENPMVGRIQRGHPIEITVYYTKDFYIKLAEANNYEIIDLKVVVDRRKPTGGNLLLFLKKKSDNDFCSPEVFWSFNEIHDFSHDKHLTIH